MKKKQLIIAGAVLLAVVVTLIIILLLKASWEKETPIPARIELLKLLSGFLLTGVIGVSVNLLIEENNRAKKTRDNDAERNRQKLELFNGIRKEMLQDLHRIYSGTKRSRRLLRAKGLTQDNRMKSEIYDEQMQLVNDYQLELELCNQEIQTDFDTGSNVYSKGASLISCIGIMERYLNNIVDEYEKKLKKFEKGIPPLTIKRMNELGDFISPSKGSGFKTIFGGQYKIVLDLIRQDILNSVKNTSPNQK